MEVIEERKCHDGTLKCRVRIRIKGRPAESETFDRRADAKEWANKREYELKQEICMGLSHAAKKTIGMMIDRYMELELPKKRSNQDATKVALLWWRDQIGERTLAELTPSLLSECRDRLLNEPYTPCKYGPADWKGSKKGPATVVRYMTSMSHVLTIACNEWQWIAVNIMTKVKRPTLPRGRVRFLSDEERGRLLAACRQSHWEDLYTLVILALSTGARKSELLGLQWKDIEPDRVYRRRLSSYSAARVTLFKLPKDKYDRHCSASYKTYQGMPQPQNWSGYGVQVDGVGTEEMV